MAIITQSAHRVLMVRCLLLQQKCFQSSQPPAYETTSLHQVRVVIFLVHAHESEHCQNKDQTIPHKGDMTVYTMQQ